MKTRLFLLLTISSGVGCDRPKPQPPDANSGLPKFDLAAYTRDARERVRERNRELEQRCAALREAARLGDMKSFRQLIDDGADSNQALELAARAGEFELCRQLIDKGANVDNKVCGFPVIALAALKHPDILQMLIDASVNVRQRISCTCGETGYRLIGDNSTLLHHAAADGVPKTVKVLLRLGLGVNDQNAEKQTPLHLAAIRGNGSIVQVLIEHGADERAQDKDGRTPKERVRRRHDSHANELDADGELAVKLLGGGVRTLHE